MIVIQCVLFLYIPVQKYTTSFIKVCPINGLVNMARIRIDTRAKQKLDNVVGLIEANQKGIASEAIIKFCDEIEEEYSTE